MQIGSNVQIKYPDMSIYDAFMKKKVNCRDTNTNAYSSVDDMWRKELDPIHIEMEKNDSNSILKGDRVGSL